MDFLPKNIEAYASRFSTSESEALKTLNRETHAKVLNPRMLSGHLQGRLLSFISRMLRPSRILEVGTYTGYSAICLAEGSSQDGILHTIDRNPELEGFAREHIVQAGFDKQIVQHVGEALDILPTLRERFDLVFLDADKVNYVRYFEMVYPRLRQGGILVADNVLWSGKVLGPVEGQDEEAMGIVRFNESIQAHPGVRNLLLPFRDGVMLVEKTAAE